jgi:tetratricopeptide (TPR) repeat protein
MCDPQSGMILDTVAEMHERRGEWGKAARYYERALERSYDGIAETHTKYGRTLLAMGQRKRAIVHLRRAVRIGNWRWRNAASRILARLGESERPTP